MLKNLISGSAIIEGQPFGEFQTITGGKVVAPTVKDRAPGQKYPTALSGAADIENVTLSRTFKPAVDGPLLTAARAKVGTDNASVTLFVRDKSGNVKPHGTYSATLVGCTPPEGDTNADNDKAAFELEFAVSGVV